MRSVQELATEARLDLSWLAALHHSLKERQGDITNGAKKLLLAPKPPRFESSAPEVTEKDIRNLDDAFAMFHGLAKAAKRGPVDDGGHYLNKSAIVYASAIVENFVKKAFDETFGERKLDGTIKPGPLDRLASLSGYISVIAGTNTKSKHRGKRKGKRKPYIADFAVGSEGVCFQAQLRNNIVHAHGVMDPKELNEIEPFLSNIEGTKFPVGFKREFLQTCRESGRVWLHVVKVVVPCLWSAFDFVGSAEAKFTTAAAAKVTGRPRP